MKIIGENTPIKVGLARNLYYIRLLSNEMDTFVKQCKTTLYEQR